MKQKVARWMIGLAMAAMLGLGLASQTAGSASRAYANDPTPTPTNRPDCGTLGCGGG